MEWYHYLAAFFSGAFLANAVPHFVHGISGDKFPTPFAKPPGVGLSSAPANVIWGLVNLAAGYVLLRVGKVSGDLPVTVLISFAGAAAISILIGIHFQGKQKE